MWLVDRQLGGGALLLWYGDARSANPGFAQVKHAPLDYLLSNNELSNFSQVCHDIVRHRGSSCVYVQISVKLQPCATTRYNASVPYDAQPDTVPAVWSTRFAMLVAHSPCVSLGEVCGDSSSAAT
jgi:hypothetical protein